MRYLSLVLFLLLAACYSEPEAVSAAPDSSALPTSADPAADCRQNSDVPLQISGCTGLIDDGDTSTEDRALAYRNRAIAYLQQDDEAAARADFDQSIAALPNWYLPHLERGHLNEYQHKFGDALTDSQNALTLAQEVSSTDDNAAKNIDFLNAAILRLHDSIEMEERWTAYLEGIQSDSDYPNWSGPPADLYAQNDGENR